MAQIRDHVKTNVATLEAEDLSNAKGLCPSSKTFGLFGAWPTQEVFSRRDKEDFILDNRNRKLI
ncbi:MAG TPA: hypothetical protein VGR30_04440 [Candidatus Binatia bacterium]|jgi:hypothetical protein|nr:hypothetical protein [Candidatus Binatia bacterium]